MATRPTPLKAASATLKRGERGGMDHGLLADGHVHGGAKSFSASTHRL
jgi:hypothetical protein